MAQLEQDAIDQVTEIVTKALADKMAGVVTSSDVSKAVDVAIKTAMAELKPGDAIKLDDVKKLVADELKAAADAAAAKKGEDDKVAARKAKRDAFAAEKLADVPKAYHASLPDTDDQAELDNAAKTIREQFRTDAAAAGYKLPDVGAVVKDGKAVDVVADPSKLSPSQMIELGLKAGLPKSAAAESK